jgi:hypothetical protein
MYSESHLMSEVGVFLFADFLVECFNKSVFPKTLSLNWSVAFYLTTCLDSVLCIVC